MCHSLINTLSFKPPSKAANNKLAPWELNRAFMVIWIMTHPLPPSLIHVDKE